MEAVPPLVLRPRLETVSHSLWWKEALEVATTPLPDMPLDDGELGIEQRPLSALLSAAAVRLGWPPVGQLLRLDGFDQPWERALSCGRELDASKSVEQLRQEGHLGGQGRPAVIVYVRRALKADGWKIAVPEDFLTDSDDDAE
uniref:Uncharacterized protein n=1 Tax=Chlamydomonas euryale TaxID=1486919 RepID=A0A7R9VCU7_9CHLO|mmetsp:Transcript_30605/g.90763  ORF Transcript_30605/g.90763 Transcript_30605/m.90763 type:complete len:143 (+) Transcript_30605:208-636(+)